MGKQYNQPIEWLQNFKLLFLPTLLVALPYTVVIPKTLISNGIAHLLFLFALPTTYIFLTLMRRQFTLGIPRNALFFAVLYLAVITLGFEINDFEKSKDLTLLIVNLFAVSQLHSRLHLPFLYLQALIYIVVLFTFSFLNFGFGPMGPFGEAFAHTNVATLLPVIFVAFLRREHWFAALLTFIVWHSGTLAHLVAILIFLGFYLVASIGLKSELVARSCYVIFIISFLALPYSLYSLFPSQTNFFANLSTHRYFFWALIFEGASLNLIPTTANYSLNMLTQLLSDRTNIEYYLGMEAAQILSVYHGREQCIHNQFLELVYDFGLLSAPLFFFFALAGKNFWQIALIASFFVVVALNCQFFTTNMFLPLYLGYLCLNPPDQQLSNPN